MRKKNLTIPSEYDEQCHLVAWLKWHYPKVLFTASAGGMRTSIGTAKKMKKMGYSKGCPDLMIFERGGYIAKSLTYNALFIELKRLKGGHISPEQNKWLAELEKRSYRGVVCHGAENAKRVIKDYLEGVSNA